MAAKFLSMAVRRCLLDVEKCLVTGASNVRHSSNFKAAFCVEHNKPLEFRDVVRNPLQKGEIRVKIHAAAVNAKDVACISNHGYRYLYSGKAPFIPGFEICGEVLELGPDVKKFKPGDRVICLNHCSLGGFAEECVANLPDCWGINQDVSFDTGAALMESYGTALLAFGHRSPLKGKEVVLVTAAAGGLGLAAVDVAANVFKSKVIGVCSSEERGQEVRDMGAWKCMAYDHEHLVGAVKEVTDGKGVDVVFEAIGGPAFESALKCVKHEGSVMVVAFASGKVPRIGAHQLFPNSPSVTGISLPHYRERNERLVSDISDGCLELLTRKLISPKVSHRYPLDKVNEALAVFSDALKTGKILVTPHDKGDEEVVKKEEGGSGKAKEKKKDNEKEKTKAKT